MTRSFEELIAEADAAPVEGWDFSWLDGRATEARPSWGYQRLLGERLRAATAALDIQTGGGEVLAGAVDGARPATLVATEGWMPNLERAAALLHPIGAAVVGAAEDGTLPFRDAAFDLVTSRHPATVRWDEIARVLAAGGTYFAQHVGGGTNHEIARFFGLEPGRADRRDHHLEADHARRAGLEIVDLRNEQLALEFFDVGAMVWFLRKVIWTVPGFTPDAHRARLRDLHEQIERDGVFRSTMSRTLVEARQPRR